MKTNQSTFASEVVDAGMASLRRRGRIRLSKHAYGRVSASLRRGLERTLDLNQYRRDWREIVAAMVRYGLEGLEDDNLLVLTQTETKPVVAFFRDTLLAALQAKGGAA